MRYSLQDSSYTAVHCIGNGRVCVYGNGISLFQMFGPHYSGPSIGMLYLGGSADQAESSRIPETSVWEHTLYDQQAQVSTLHDFVLPDGAVFIREINGTAPLVWKLSAELTGWKTLSPTICGQDNVLWTILPEGTRYYTYCGDFGYVTDKPILAAVAFTGAEEPIQSDGMTLTAMITKGRIALAFAQDMSDLVKELKRIPHGTNQELLESAIADGRQFTHRRHQNVRLPDELEPIAEDIAFLIKGQQAATGGVLAGPIYHLAYVRDNYGVLRGLLSLGCYREACALIQFYNEVFQRRGCIHNAQETSEYGKAFHIHENDQVEITGYLVHMVMDCYQYTHDEELLHRSLPMLWWCILQQHRMLQDGMLPFNGDETYIAGGVLPRTAINDGSMEATVLYYEACQRLLKNAKRLKLNSQQQDLLEQDIQEIASQFKDHFLIDGQLAANCPGYYDSGEAPQTGHGFYLCGHGMGACGCRNAEGLLVCPDCVEKRFPELSQYSGKRFFLPSAVLMPIFVGTTLLTDEQKKREVQTMLTRHHAGLSLSGEKSDMTVGYELGSLLYAALPYPEFAQDINALCQSLLSVRDETGAWVEYYRDGQPFGCRCRPWESGISIAALIELAKEKA